MAATVAVAGGGWTRDFGTGTPVLVCFISGLLTCGMVITLCSVGVGTVTGLLAESRSRVCWPAGCVADPRRFVRRRWYASGCAPGGWWRRLHRRRRRPV